MRKPLALAAVVLLASSSLAAQTIWLGAGPTFPTSDYGTYAKTGWMASGGFALGLGQSGKVSLLFEGLYGSNSHTEEDDPEASTTLYGGMLGLEYDLGNVKKVHPYVFGSGGLLVHKYNLDGSTYDGESDSKFTVQFGGGLSIPLGKIGIWADIRYLTRLEDEATAVIPIMAGIYIPLGK
jgi:hypothetical protein